MISDFKEAKLPSAQQRSVSSALVTTED